MSEAWQQFEGLVRGWVAGEQIRDPRLPSRPEAFVAAAYEHWLKDPLVQDKRRTLNMFESRIERLYGSDGAVPSLFRKLKGSIRPRQDELERLLAALFLQRKNESDITSSDRKEIEPFAKELAHRLLNPAADLIEDETSVRIIASWDSMVLGPNDYTRDEKFGELMNWRAYEAAKLPTKRLGTITPHTLWVLDTSSLEEDGEDAFRARRAITRLTSALMAVFARRLPAPDEAPSLEFYADAFLELPEDIEISRRDDTPQANEREDLRSVLRRTSAICIIGKIPEKPTSQYSLRRGTDKGFFKKALFPEFVFLQSHHDGEKNTRLHFASASDMCLGTKIDFQQASNICDNIVEDAEKLAQFTKDISFDMPQHIWSFLERPGDGPGELVETPLDREKVSPAIKTAIKLVLTAAAAKLTDGRGGQSLKEGTVGVEARNLLLDCGVTILTIDEFLDFKSWFLDVWNPLSK